MIHIKKGVARKVSLLFLFVFWFVAHAEGDSGTEEIVLTTYYPVPYGDYQELRVKRVAIGDSYYSSSQYCWGNSSNCANPINSSADLVVEGNVGIGTVNPRSPAPNTKEGNLEVNDIYVRSIGKWLSEALPRFGAWEEKSLNNTYYAQTDGFVQVYLHMNWGNYWDGSWGGLEGYTDQNNPPQTRRALAGAVNVNNSDWPNPGSFTMPVRKGDYWRVAIWPTGYAFNCSTYKIFWIAFGT